MTDTSGNTGEKSRPERTTGEGRYLVGVHNLDLQRLVQPFGYRDSKPVAEQNGSRAREKPASRDQNFAEQGNRKYGWLKSVGFLPGNGEEAAILAFASVLTILSFASRAFAFYYFLQCLVAICVTESRAVSKSEGSNWVNRITGIV